MRRPAGSQETIWTVHGRMRGEPQLDFDRLGQINGALGIPLVIHGGTGLSDAQVRKLIDRGVTKVNYYTALSDAAAERIRENVVSAESGGYTSHDGGRSASIGAIPGVREVVTGEAVAEGAAYHYCWNVRFCYPAVIDSYRNHPDHVRFADTLFRPAAGNRLSIDFRALRD
jgi:fructose-bisphosphate aldolase class II